MFHLENTRADLQPFHLRYENSNKLVKYDSGSGSITKVSTTGTTGENVADDPTASTVATSLGKVYWDDIYGKYAQNQCVCCSY